MARLQGMTGLNGPIVPQPAVGETGTPVTDWGVPVSRAHSVPGDSSGQAPSGGNVYGPVIATGGPVGVPLAGLPGPYSDATPDTHTAPTAATGVNTVDDPVVYAQQRAALHGRDLGAPNATFGWHVPYPEHPSVGSDGTLINSPNNSVLADEVPEQLRSGGRQAKDVDQGLGHANGFGFQFGHAVRRWFSDPVPQNIVNADERAFFGKHPVWQNRLDNDSRFGVAGDISRDMMLGKTPTTDPTPWEQPANPTYRSTTDYPESGFDDDWMAG